MPEITDFKCTFLDEGGLDEDISERLGLVFPDAHLRSEHMQRIALALKEKNGSPFCSLPFCHTVEGDAMGGLVNYGGAVYGPRAGGYICASVEELLELPDIDFDSGRIAEVLDAVRSLSARGEKVLLEVCGPFTILNVLIDAKHLFRAIRKQPELFSRVYEYMRRNLLEYVARAADSGASIICYADSAGGLNILGPKIMADMVGQFTHPFLKKALEITAGRALIQLCPKTTLSLIGTGAAEWGSLDLGGPMSYREGCLAAVGRADIAGENCVKNLAYRLDNGILRTICLK